jgi:putative hydrolase of the HAD superfamily
MSSRSGSRSAQFAIWDFDGTLATREGGWTGAICETVGRFLPECKVDPECIQPHLRSGFPWHKHDVVRAPCSDNEWWENLLPVLQTALISGAALDPLQASGVAREVRGVYTESSRWQVYDDAVPVLDELQNLGWQHLMLSNHVPELDRLVTDLRLHSYFSGIYNSARTGVEKPHPASFHRVFRDHPAARDGWMIGDSWEADIQAAQRVGLRAILVRRQHRNAQFQCRELKEVIPILAR